ncbi:type II toxin-antitoxin system VapC family toxin [Salinarimonas ramus]|uniref:Ribonuclease VapC n=1 Tax=Salinarimonas ramus TaxID=690164 RepID=A0A917V7I5_9HYPH|nr:type II toxin-antitoxin system VapC family toxin [Salinarimonas ramus]GGK47539.1 hypothetical protein GCM10011322_38250 [Salinarimonas ramus]
MSVLVDTSAWIEWLIGSRAGLLVAERLPAEADWIVPTMVQLELTKWLTREVGDDEADRVIAFSQICRVVDLDTAIALDAADACRTYRLSSADAIVFATARHHGATLLTCDAHFEGLPDVTVIAKAHRT